MKTIYYYQTFIGLDKALTHINDIDVIPRNIPGGPRNHFLTRARQPLSIAVRCIEDLLAPSVSQAPLKW